MMVIYASAAAARQWRLGNAVDIILNVAYDILYTVNLLKVYSDRSRERETVELVDSLREKK